MLSPSRVGGIAVVSLAAFLIMSWVMYREFRNLLIDQGIQLAEQFAHTSRAVFLVNDLTAIKQTSSIFQGFPGVRYLAIVDRNFRIRYEDGVPSARTHQGHRGFWPEHGTLAAEDNRLWHFIAPIRIRDADANSPYVERTRPEKELVGYVLLDIDKDRLRRLAFVLVPINAAIGAGLSILLITWTKKETLRAHADVLESEVRIRTQDAFAARDAALTADRHKSEFLATVTHEMRTPLNGIIGYTQLALESLEYHDDKPNETELKVVLKNAVQLLALINNILDTSALEAGKMDVTPELVNLKELVHSAIDTVRPFVLKNSNRLEHQISGNEMVIVDKAKLQQILLNLLTNAANFTHCGHITLIGESTATQLRIEVSDTGIGIPKDQQALIFQPFRKVEIDNAYKYQGTGLGLAISQAFCLLMGGTITVKSSMNAGSTFTVTIPLPVRFKGHSHIDGTKASKRL
jgi:signal transduction histidine kinase